MATKRPLNAAEDVSTGNDAYLKRQKISHQKNSHVAATAEDIQSSRQLKQLLAFDQDLVRSRHGIQSFKIFLDGFADAPNRKSILQEYLQSQKPADPEDKNAVFLNDLMQTWSFASQSNNDSLLSAVPALLALLLRTISSNLELSTYSTILCKTLLQKRQLELLARNLTTNSGKDFIISPTLRLLKEVAGSDGEGVIGQLWRARDYTFRSLGRNLGIRAKTDAIEDPRKPSIRTNAVRFLLTCIRRLPADAKKEICQQKDIVASLTRPLNLDPPSLIEDILETLKTNIVQDKELHRDSKNRMLNSASLGRIVSLYNYQYVAKEGESPISVDQIAHEFLIAACTTPGISILHPQRGFYPRGVDADNTQDLEGGQGFINLGLDSLDWASKFKTNVPVQNTILSDFIKSLRPWSNLKQSELLLTIFRAAPELVADYFFGKKDFSFEPKLTATWIGYSALIFSTVSLPLPEFFGYRGGFANLPPPTSIVIESIIPAPANQKALTRCLNHKSSLIRFFGVRLLTVALKKLRDALRMYAVGAEDHSKIWDEAKDKLVDEFCERCPTMKNAITAFKNTSKADLMQRHATTQLLAMYFEVIPQVALDAKLDISSSLIETLELSKEGFPRQEDAELQAMIIENLFQIANYSPGMRWFTKVEPLKLSPFIAMLQQALSSTSDSKLHDLIRAVASENHILQSATEKSPASALIATLNSCGSSTAATFDFLDNCVLRCEKAPIKYFDQLEEFYMEAHGEKSAEKKIKDSPLSLLLVVMLEQWPFVVKSRDEFHMKDIAQFISHYLATSLKIKEDKKVIKILTKKLVAETPEDSPCRKILDRSRKLVDTIEIPEYIPPETQEQTLKPAPVDPEEEKAYIINDMEQQSKAPPDDNHALTRWLTKDIEEVIEDGHAASLVMLLSSPDLAFRKEAMARLKQLAAKLKESSYVEKEQIWLLLCEVMETGREQMDEHPLPTLITAFASHAIAVLTNPLHCMYKKINKFLTEGPRWKLGSIPLMHNVLHLPPSTDDQHSQEVEWLLGYMIVGLRTKEDMDVYRKRRVFEKVLSLYNNPYARVMVKDKVLLLMFKAIKVEGGSDTLITRFSGLTWTEAQTAVETSGDVSKRLKVLMEEMVKNSDGDKIRRWKHAKVVGERPAVER